jgi:hypothetical protein
MHVRIRRERLDRRHLGLKAIYRCEIRVKIPTHGRLSLRGAERRGNPQLVVRVVEMMGSGRHSFPRETGPASKPLVAGKDTSQQKIRGTGHARCMGARALPVDGRSGVSPGILQHGASARATGGHGGRCAPAWAAAVRPVTRRSPPWPPWPSRLLCDKNAERLNERAICTIPVPAKLSLPRRPVAENADCFATAWACSMAGARSFATTRTTSDGGDNCPRCGRDQPTLALPVAHGQPGSRGIVCFWARRPREIFSAISAFSALSALNADPPATPSAAVRSRAAPVPPQSTMHHTAPQAQPRPQPARTSRIRAPPQPT